MWDGTKKLAHKIAEEIAKQSPDTRVKIFNISKTNKNDIMTEVFKSKAIAVGSPTVGNSVLSSVAGWLDFLRELKFKIKRLLYLVPMAGLVSLQRYSVKS